MDEQHPFSYTVTAGEIGPDMVTLTWPDVLPAEASTPMTLSDLDALIDAVRSTAGQELGPDYLFPVTPRTYQRLVYIHKRAHKRRWQDSQKQRAYLRRQRRVRAKIRTALFYLYQPRRQSNG